MPTRPLKNEIMGCEGAFEDILAFFQATPAPSFCTDIEIDKKQIKDIVGIDTSSSFKDLVLQSQELHDGENLVQTVRFSNNSKTCQMAVFTFSTAMIWQDLPPSNSCLYQGKIEK